MRNTIWINSDFQLVDMRTVCDYKTMLKQTRLYKRDLVIFIMIPDVDLKCTYEDLIIIDTSHGYCALKVPINKKQTVIEATFEITIKNTLYHCHLIYNTKTPWTSRLIRSIQQLDD